MSGEKKAPARQFVFGVLLTAITLLKDRQTNSFPDWLRLSCRLTGQDCSKGSNYHTMFYSRNHHISFAGFTEFKPLSAALSLPLGLQNMPVWDVAFLDGNLCTLPGSLLPPDSSNKIIIIAFLMAWCDRTEQVKLLRPLQCTCYKFIQIWRNEPKMSPSLKVAWNEGETREVAS